MGVGVDRAVWRRLTRVTLGLWIGSFLWLDVVVGLVGGRYSGWALVIPIPYLTVTILLALGLQWVIVRTAPWKVGRRTAAIVGAAIIAAGGSAFVDSWGNWWFAQHGLPSMRAAPAGDLHEWSYVLFIYSWFYSLNVSLVMLLLASETTRNQAGELVVAWATANQAQLAMLRYQLNPHFLFNTLNAISSLVVTRQIDRAEEMIGRLSGFLRHTLASDPADLVALDEELAVVEEYLEVEKVRFGERLHPRYDVPRRLGQVLVPSFILQPIIENAIKYAVSPAREPVTLTIAAREADGRLALVVTDDGAGVDVPAAGTGIGLANIAARLAAFYGGQARLAAGRLERGYRVTLDLPAWRERPAGGAAGRR